MLKAERALQKGTRKFVKITVVSTILNMVIVFLWVCIHVSRLIKMCTVDICSVYAIKWVLTDQSCLNRAIFMFVWYWGWGAGLPAC